MKEMTVNLKLGGGTLYQPANRNDTQMMSYIIDTGDGIVVIDGGTSCRDDSDAEFLYETLEKFGKKVKLWFITHLHCDHYGALMLLLEKGKFDIEVEKFCFNFMPYEWIINCQGDVEVNKRFLEIFEKQNFNVCEVQRGDVFECGCVKFKVLFSPDHEKNYLDINSTSIIIKASFPKRDVLFLGDFNFRSEEEYMEKCDVDALRCDVVQMSHHGQGGCSRAFYELINPEVCLWTAPKWLYENNNFFSDDPATAGKGPFLTLETRAWMKEMGVQENYAHAEGDYIFI